MFNSFVMLGAKNKGNFVSKLIYFILRFFFSFEIDFSTDLKIGKNVKFIHSGLGSVIHKRTFIGDNVKIYQNVTIGANVIYRNGKKENLGAPTIENNVVIFPGAKVLGNITIGEGAVVGANAVVTKNLEPFHVINFLGEKRAIVGDVTFYDPTDSILRGV